MNRVELKTSEGKSIGVLDFPTSAKEVPLKNFIRFEVEKTKMETWIAENKPDQGFPPNFQAGYILHVLNCVKAFCGDDRIDQIPVGNYMAHLAGAMRETPDSLDLESSEVAVMTLFANIWETMKTYKKNIEIKEGFSFDYKGKTYRIKKSYRDAVTNQTRFESLSTAQAVEALEANRVYQAVADQDPQKAYLFTTILHLTAILALADDEKFPETDAEIQRWSSERIRYFEDIDMESALNVYAFFFGTSKRAKKTARTGGSLSRHTKSRKARRNRKR